MRAVGAPTPADPDPAPRRRPRRSAPSRCARRPPARRSGRVTPPDPATARAGSASASSAPGRVGAVLGSALRAAGHPVVAVSAISEASRERAATLLPGVPGAGHPRGGPPLRAGAPHGARRRAGGPGARAGGRRRVAGGPDRRAHVGAVRRGRAGTGARGRGHPAGAAPGDDVHGHVAGPGAAGRLLVRGHGARRRCCPSARRSSWRSAASRWCSRRRRAGSTTRPSRTARTTWSSSSRRPRRRWRRPGVADPGRMLGPLLEAALDGALRAESTGRRRARSPR